MANWEEAGECGLQSLVGGQGPGGKCLVAVQLELAL